MGRKTNNLYPSEGTFFAIPLKSGKWAVGLYARTAKKRLSVPFGYFFKEIFDEIPSLDYVSSFTKSDALLLSRFGDLGIQDGRWKIIGIIKDWNRRDWPMPDFMIPATDIGCPPWDQLVKCSEDDPTREILRKRFPPGSLNLPRARIPGSGALEELLYKLTENQKIKTVN